MTLDKQIEEILETQGCDCLEGKSKAVATLKRLIKEVAKEVIGEDEEVETIDEWPTENLLRKQQRAKLKELLK